MDRRRVAGVEVSGRRDGRRPLRHKRRRARPLGGRHDDRILANLAVDTERNVVDDERLTIGQARENLGASIARNEHRIGPAREIGGRIVGDLLSDRQRAIDRLLRPYAIEHVVNRDREGLAADDLVRRLVARWLPLRHKTRRAGFFRRRQLDILPVLGNVAVRAERHVVDDAVLASRQIEGHGRLPRAVNCHREYPAGEIGARVVDDVLADEERTGLECDVSHALIGVANEQRVGGIVANDHALRRAVGTGGVGVTDRSPGRKAGRTALVGERPNGELLLRYRTGAVDRDGQHALSRHRVRRVGEGERVGKAVGRAVELP